MAAVEFEQPNARPLSHAQIRFRCRTRSRQPQPHACVPARSHTARQLRSQCKEQVAPHLLPPTSGLFATGIGLQNLCGQRVFPNQPRDDGRATLIGLYIHCTRSATKNAASTTFDLRSSLTTRTTRHWQCSAVLTSSQHVMPRRRCAHLATRSS
eukprot:m.896404 g.896404  ORF g.896404 m.896404 type:complete len:154 (-) comp23666_c0_seq36:1136-1597(-)